MTPLSSIWHRISSPSCHRCTVPPAFVCRSVFAATSLAASTRSVMRRAGQRAVTAGRQLVGPEIAGAGLLLALAEQGRMGAAGVAQDRGGQSGAVVQAHHRRRGPGKRGVDQGLVARGLAQLSGGALRPDRLAEAPDPPPWV